MKIKRSFKMFASLWLILGVIATAGLIIQLWQILKYPDTPLVAFIGTLPFLVLSSATIINGWALFARKRWARLLTIVLSSILIFYSVISLGLIGSKFGIIPFLLVMVLFSLALYGLWIMLSKRGEDSFGLYVSEPPKT